MNDTNRKQCNKIANALHATKLTVGVTNETAMNRKFDVNKQAASIIKELCIIPCLNDLKKTTTTTKVFLKFETFLESKFYSILKKCISN